MNTPLGIPGGVILDTSALARLGDSRTVSFLVATAGTGLHRLYASVACVDAADRLRPGIARHALTGLAGLLDPVDLTVSAVLWAREHLPTEACGHRPHRIPGMARKRPRMAERPNGGHRTDRNLPGMGPVSTRDQRLANGQPSL
jgi:hypothetical protein